MNRSVEFVTSEYSEAGGGSIDILVRVPGLAIGLENKLWEHGHDGAGERGQAERYRDLVDRYRRQQALPRLALVLLTCREGLRPGTTEDYPEDWLCVSRFRLSPKRHLRCQDCSSASTENLRRLTSAVMMTTNDWFAKGLELC
jgi:hypothetical protein